MATAAGDQEDFACSRLMGVVALRGSAVDRIGNRFAEHVPSGRRDKRNARDGKHFHITVLNPDEAKKYQDDIEIARLFGEVTLDDIHPLGVGRIDEVYFCVVESPLVNKIRKGLGLTQKDLHITLGFQTSDCHDKRKDARSVCDPLATDPEALKRALIAYIEIGEVQETMPILTLALECSARSPNLTQWEELVRAKAAGQHGHFEQVVSLCEPHVDNQETAFHAAYLLGFALVKMKKLAEAAAVLDKALAAKPDHARGSLVQKIVELAQMCHEKTESGALIFKFPRTHHIFDAGGSGVTRDDLLLDAQDAASYLQREIAVEEKIDGANLGIWLDSDYAIRCQNRAHFVTSESGAQWKGLEQWLEAHAPTLSRLLEPRKHILFGEWMYAKHSIEYDRLPSYFVAFDLYDIAQKKFFSRRRLYQLLAGTNIAVVPMIHRGQVDSLETFRVMLDTPSVFKSNGAPVEGVYIRVDDAAGMWLERRCKLVRPDFIQGIETHWMLQNLVKNKVDVEFSYEYADVVAALGDLMAHAPAAAEQFPFAVGQYTEPRSHITGSNGATLPRNFGFVTEWLALSSIPKTKEQCQGMAVDMIVTLTDEERLPERWFAAADTPTNLYAPIPNYEPPSMAEMDVIVEAVEQARRHHGKRFRVMVHCGGGKGRAGTVAACLLLHAAIVLRQPPPDLAPEDAASSAGVVAFLRRLRPGCVETERQEAFIRHYSDRMWARQAEEG